MHFTPGRSRPILDNNKIASKENCFSFPKQFSDRRSDHAFGVDGRKCAEKCRFWADFGHMDLWISQMFYAHYEGVRICPSQLYVFCRGLRQLSKTVFRSKIGSRVRRRRCSKVDQRKRSISKKSEIYGFHKCFRGTMKESEFAYGLYNNECRGLRQLSKTVFRSPIGSRVRRWRCFKVDRQRRQSRN